MKFRLCRAEPGSAIRKACLAAVLALLALASARADEVKPLRPSERMRPERLAATQAGVAALQKERRQLPPARAGMSDFRSIFHAHASDSEHTGGTLEEMLADAKLAGVKAIFLGSHFRPPRDFMESWRGLHDGVLFIPGSEARAFLLSPEASILPKMYVPDPEFLAAVNAGEGLAFLSHIEEKPEYSMNGLVGLEIYNRHYDAKLDMTGLIAMAMRLTSRKGSEEFLDLLRRYPDEILAAQVTRQEVYLDKWDRETAKGGRFTGIAANDCHHNQIFVVKMQDESHVLIGTNVDPDKELQVVSATERPGIRELTRGRKPGDLLVSADLDPYYRSFRNASTHLFAPELTERALRAAVKAGRAYVSHDWLCDPSGFRFETNGDAWMGDETPFRPGLVLRAQTPAPCRLRLLQNGKEAAFASGRELVFGVKEPGVYRLEASLEIDGDLRPWIYSNPIYVRQAAR